MVRLRRRFTYPIKETGAQLEKLRIEQDRLRKDLDDLKTNDPTNYSKRNELASAINQKGLEMSQVRDWYSAALMEGLVEESRTLKWLTIGLIVLTAILTIFTGYLIGIRF